MKKKNSYFLFLWIIACLTIQYVKSNKGIYGYNGFSTYEWEITPNNTECISWNTENINDKNIYTNYYLSVTINPGCTKGLVLKDTSNPGFFSAFQYYSDLEMQLIVLEGKLDIRLEEPDSDISIVIKSFDASDFNEEDVKNHKFSLLTVPFPEEQENELSILNFSNPDPEKSVKFYMRKARLIYITPRPILDNLRLYGNDWSYNVEDTSFNNNIFYKNLKSGGCLSIDLQSPKVGPWASIKFDIKTHPNFYLVLGLEIKGIFNPQIHTKDYFNNNGIVLSEDYWTTIEIELNNYIVYEKLYDRLNFCNYSNKTDYFYMRNIYFEPVYKYESTEKEVQSCCPYNQCICTVQYKKLYIRRNSTSDGNLNSNKNRNNAFILTFIINLIITLLFII